MYLCGLSIHTATGEASRVYSISQKVINLGDDIQLLYTFPLKFTINDDYELSVLIKLSK